ncbi:MAG: hypothetical protein GY906_07480 [bacterium]|nr:hypothetical protein [bacterium]
MPTRATAAASLLEVLAQDLGEPVFLTRREVSGAWPERLNCLASTLPDPYPLFAPDEQVVVARGYPVLVSSGIQQLRREIEKQLAVELEYRVDRELRRGGDKSKVMVHRDRYLRSLTALLENAMLNDYGRGFVEVFLLFHSQDVASAVEAIPRLARRRELEIGREKGSWFQYDIARVFADLMHRAAIRAIDGLKRLAHAVEAPSLSPLVTELCQDPLLLAESGLPANFSQLSPYLDLQLRQEAQSLLTTCAHASTLLDQRLALNHSLLGLLHLAVGDTIDLGRPEAFLEPTLLEALRSAGLIEDLGFAPVHLSLLNRIGERLKMCELIVLLRQRILPVERRGNNLVLVHSSRHTPIATSTRPFDFANPGIVESSVKRFGLVYDLTNFTALLEEVRKKGQTAEEKALQFMYLFQSRLERVRGRRRLTFEKFLGDGAFYSARRAKHVMAAAAEIQLAYDKLRHRGFPFDQGMRIAVNYSTYRLLPMLSQGQGGRLRFEFFGHGIVELARLTTGKSTREIEEIAEFLVHSGFPASRVDDFLAPLLTARGGKETSTKRAYAAWIDERGELFNEGIVLSLPFVEELAQDLEGEKRTELDADGARWILFPVDPKDDQGPYYGLRYLGVARLKGLAPMELVEATAWEARPTGAEDCESAEPLLTLLRRLVVDGGQITAPEEDETPIPPDLVAVTFLDEAKRRCWLFGYYRAGDDVLLHSIQAPIRATDIDRGQSLEVWLLQNRSGLVKLYEGLRRETSGQTVPLHSLRHHSRFEGCYLSAPHRAPGD